MATLSVSMPLKRPNICKSVLIVLSRVSSEQEYEQPNPGFRLFSLHERVSSSVNELLVTFLGISVALRGAYCEKQKSDGWNV